MAFDPSTAKPVSAGGFDPSTAKPIDPAPPQRDAAGRPARTGALARKEFGSAEDKLRAVGQGLTFGLSDEIASGGAAGILKLMSLYEGTDRDLGDIFDEVMADSASSRAQYAKEFPVESAAMEVVGGLTSGPLGLAKAGAKVGATKLGQQVAGTKLGQTLAKSRTAKVAGATALSAGEGALYGAGSAKPGERIEGAKKGMMMGAGVGGGMNVAGLAGKGMINQATKRRIEKDLITEAGDQMPISMADPEGRLGGLYRNMSSAMGGGGIKKQAKVVSDRAEEAIKDLDDNLFDKVLRESRPTGATKKLDSDKTIAYGQVEDEWKNSFDMVKKHNFRINPSQLDNKIRDTLNSSPQYRDHVDAIMNTVSGKLGGQMGSAAPRTVPGPEMMEARNWFKRNMPGSDASEPSVIKAAYREVADIIDDEIVTTLRRDSPEVAEAFTKELTNYRKYRVLQKAMDKGAKAVDPDSFVASHLHKAATQQAGKKAATRTGAFQQEAVEAVNKRGALEETIKQAKRATPENESSLNRILSTAAWSGGAGLLTGNPLLAVPLGMTAAGTLASKPVQRAVAGQTKAQEALARGLRRYEGSKAQDAMGLLGRGVRTPILLEDE